ncbi:MAG: glycoside-pentoside-hexuronide (GPH):cation symporter [bacterium]|nr:MFS transporter [Gammaproteobacteria bacterium]HIL98361.1 MFS transporter [Pseudomonadales bacterium]
MSSIASSQPSTASSPSSKSALPFSTKIYYGAPNFAGAALAIPIAIHLTIFYSDTILVPLGIIALVKALARSLDAITDPVMGWVSDKTRTRWGRRRPWMAVGAPLAALAFYLMFTPPEDLDGVTAATWFAVTYTLYYVFHTVYIIPYAALGPELTLDYHERSALFGIREGFVMAGTLVAAVLPPILISQLGGPRQGYTSFAIIFGSLLVILYLNLVVRVKERPSFMTRESNPLIPGVRRVMRNKVFRLLLIVYLVGSITGAIPGLMMPYFTKYVLQPENPDMWLAIFLASYFLAGFLSLPVWVWLSRKFEKKPVWLAGYLPGIFGSLGLFTLDKGDLIPAIFILVISGFGFSAGLFLGPSMQADVIDYDELHTGKRREAQYGALWSICTKFMVIPSMSVPLAILATVGYAPNVEQTESVQFTIRAIFCLAPACMAITAFSIGWFYPLTKKKHEEIWQGIEAHRKGESVIDPITGYIVHPPGSRGVDEAVGWELDHFSLAELELLIEKGKQALGKHTLFLSLACLSSFVIFAYLLVTEITDIASAPGLLAVVYVVASGISFTAAVYHFSKFVVSTKLEIPEDAIIQAHLKVTREMVYGLKSSG